MWVGAWRGLFAWCSRVSRSTTTATTTATTPCRTAPPHQRQRARHLRTRRSRALRHAEDGGFEPPRAFTQHAFQVPQRGVGSARLCTFPQVSEVRGWFARPLDRAGSGRTATETATKGVPGLLRANLVSGIMGRVSRWMLRLALDRLLVGPNWSGARATGYASSPMPWPRLWQHER